MAMKEGLAGRDRWPLVGRSSEIDAFDAEWADKHCQGLVVHGLAGVGKTRLAEEFLHRAVANGWRGGRATASKAAAAVPLGAIAHLIPASVDLSDPVSGFASVAAALAGAGPTKRRWAVFVDDLHLLDTTSAVLLQQLMDMGVARLIGTVRTGEPISEAVNDLIGGDLVRRIDLDVLDAEQTEAVLCEVLGGPVGRRTLTELHSASGGNVLYLQELILGVLQADALASDGEIWELSEERPVGTPRLTELIGARLAAVSAEARRVLQLTALCEPLPISDAEAVATSDILADLQSAGLIRVVESQRRAIVLLGHPLYGEALRGGMAELRRRSLLMEQVERVEAAGARRRDDALRIAAWRLSATGAADPNLLLQAAALARHAHDYNQVVALLNALPEQACTVRSRLLLGEALWELGRWQEAESVLAEASREAETESEYTAVTLARTWNMWLVGSRTDRALIILEEARGRIESRVGKHILRINEGCIRAVTGDPARGAELLEELEPSVDRAPDTNVWVLGALMKANALSMLGRAMEAEKWARGAYESQLLIDNQTLAPHPASQLISLTVALVESGNLTEAQEIGEKAFDELAASHAVLPRVWAAFHLARAYWMSGQMREARRWFAQATILARKHHHTPVLRLSLSGLAASAAVLGDVAAAEKTAEEAENYPVLGFLRGEESLGAAWACAAAGKYSIACSMLMDAAEMAKGTSHFSSESLLLTEAMRLGASKAAADRLAEIAERSTGRLAVARSNFAAAVFSGKGDDLLASSDELQAIGAYLLAAEAANAAATAYHRVGSPRAASVAARRAHACSSHCEGAKTPLLASAQSVSLLTPREREIAALAASGITSREIAETLHLSVRTVDNHLQRAYTKLGVATRRELKNALVAG